MVVIITINRPILCYLYYDRVEIALGYRQDSRSLIPGKGNIFSSPQHLDQICVPPSLLSSGYQELFPRGKVAGA
jgi:hypothetical protein